MSLLTTDTNFLIAHTKIAFVRKQEKVYSEEQIFQFCR